MSTRALWPRGIPEPADLRLLLLAHHPWLAATDLGPQAVEAGECDRCGTEPRLAQVCGPSAYSWLGRACALELGPDAWCAGHADDARAMLEWLDALPDHADDVTRLWWLTTGEVRLDPALAVRWTRAALGGAPAAD